MNEIYFVDIDISLSRPGQIVNAKGKIKSEKLRRFTCSLPIRDKGRAEELLDHFAQGLAEIFKEVEAHDQAQRHAAQEASRNTGRIVHFGDDLKIVDDASGQIPGPGSTGGDPLGVDLPSVDDGKSGRTNPGEEA